MPDYHIKEIEKLSGIKAHTIRIWEKRYNIIEPTRTETNRRLYDDKELKRILNIAMLNKNGYKISKIAALSNAKLSEKILKLSEGNGNIETQIVSLINAMIDMDEKEFNIIFQKSKELIGFQNTLLELIYPFFKRIGILWLTGNIDPAQEHFISNAVRQKIISAIDQLPYAPKEMSKTFVLFLPDGQWHEMGLLISSYLIKRNGHHAVYLGSSLPLDSVVNLKGRFEFQSIVTTLSIGKTKDELKEELHFLAKTFPEKIIFVGGISKDAFIDMPNNLKLSFHLNEFNDYLKSS